MMSTLRPLCFLAALTLVGCATPPVKQAKPSQPAIEISDATWQLINRDIHTENLVAKSVAVGFARREMEEWRQRVQNRAESHFIPWYSGYMTQQWLTTKVAWYTLSSGTDGPGPEDRLASYIQEQYYTRVLAPVAEHIDPLALPGNASKRYVQHLRQQLRLLPERHGIPELQFQQRLREIPAIHLNVSTAPEASLYDLVHSDPIDNLPPYAALLQRIHESGRREGLGLSKTRISPVARRVSEQLVEQLAIKGGTGAASTVMGKVAGSVFSLGVSAISFIWHQARREDIEIGLRQTLDTAMDDMWAILVDSPDSSVTSGIYHLFEQIDGSLPQTFSHALPWETPPQAITLPESSGSAPARATDRGN